jgi:hypothetical protein
LAKAAAILATVLSIALGLCGMNFGAFFLFWRLRPPDPWIKLSNLLVMTAFTELAAILLSAAGLLIVLLFYIVKLIEQGLSAGPKGER